MSVKLYSLAHKERSLPLLYSSDSNADDLPYWDPSPTGKGGLLMLPFSYDCTDARFNMRGSGWASPKDYFLHLVSRCANPALARSLATAKRRASWNLEGGTSVQECGG